MRRPLSLERYRDLRRRLQRLEAVFDDRARLDRVIASGRYFKLVLATARAHETIEREFGVRQARRRCGA